MDTICPSCGKQIDGGLRFCPDDGTPLPRAGRTSIVPAVDQVVDGRYRLLEKLGAGGMAVVFRARNEALGRTFALKVLHSRWAEDRKTVARFAREARAASQIDHPNVVKVFDFGYADEGFYFLAMELLEGESLEKTIESAGRLRPGRALGILAQIADGMARAHELGVVHRDLKPDNVIVRRVDGREHVTVVDFGLSKLEGSAAVTAEGDVVGTPDYMAPELWMGRGVDERVDVYAFGVMAYELLSGKLPFGGETLLEKLNAHLMQTPAPLAQTPVGAELPKGLSELVARCFARDASTRPPHMGVVLRALRTLAESHRDELRREPTRIGAAAPENATLIAVSDEVELDRLGLVAEIARLRAVRQHRMAELVPELCVNDPELSAIASKIADAERAAESAAEDVAVAVAALEESQRAHRAKEAELRAQLVEANLQIAVNRNALPDELAAHGATMTLSIDDAELEELAPGEVVAVTPARDRLRMAEARLASYLRAEDEASAEASRRLGEALARERAAKGPLDALFFELERRLRLLPAAEPAFAELWRLDLAISGYEQRLERMERAASARPSQRQS